MTKPVAFTQRDVEAIVAGAIAGGLQPGTFAVAISPKTGELRLLPAKPIKGDDDEALAGELKNWLAKNGDG